MKTIAAILLTCLLLFNLYGYRLVSAWVQSRDDIQLEAALNNNIYDRSELITVKVPLANPYLHQQTSFERVDGEVEIDGIQYKYLERGVINDSIAYVCIPNHARMRSDKALQQYFSGLNDLSRNQPGKSKGLVVNLKHIFTEFELKKYEWNMIPLTVQKQIFCHRYFLNLPDQTTGLPLQPPERLS